MEGSGCAGPSPKRRAQLSDHAAELAGVLADEVGSMTGAPERHGGFIGCGWPRPDCRGC